MSVISNYLRNSRLHQARQQLERGESVDWDRLTALQAADIVCIGQEVLADAIEREEKADDAFAAAFGESLPARL